MLSIRLVLLILLLTPGFIQEVDILDFAATHPLNKSVQQPDGTWRSPKFGDDLLEQAAAGLKSYSRPWTVSKVISWCDESRDNKTKSLLLRVLAASRDPRGAIILGGALSDEGLEIRAAATYGLLDYFMGGGIGGGTEEHMRSAQEWWKANRERLWVEADRMNAKKGT